MQVNILEAKTELSELIRLIETGKEDHIIIARYGKPVVKLTSCSDVRYQNELGLQRANFVRLMISTGIMMRSESCSEGQCYESAP